MYSEEDLNSAVAAGAITPDAAAALREHVARLRRTPHGDEENFRLVNSFNDIFVTIACLLVVFAAAVAGGTVAVWIGGAFVTAVAWIMAEFFTRQRRMALPSIVLLIAFVLGLGFAAYGLLHNVIPQHMVEHTSTWDGKDHTWTTQNHHDWQKALMALAAAIAAGIGALLHWLRFRVAITVAAVVGAAVLLVLSAIAAITDSNVLSGPVFAPLALICGIAVFAYAMYWDMSDPTRRSQSADVAFWLHLLAAPLIAHPLFNWLGVNDSDMGTGAIFGVLAIYVLFGVVALIVDRRALLVSALLYVLLALSQLLRFEGEVEMSLALTTFFIGSALLVLSVLWSRLRRRIVEMVPVSIANRLPPAETLT